MGKSYGFPLSVISENMRYTIRKGASVYMTISPDSPIQNSVWPPKHTSVYNAESCVFETARVIIFDDADVYEYSYNLKVFRLPLSVSKMLGVKMTRVYMVVSTFNVTESA